MARPGGPFRASGAQRTLTLPRAVDSLRQLSLKFLAKEELKAFTFQRAFLKPFERAFRANQVVLRGPGRGRILSLVWTF